MWAAQDLRYTTTTITIASSISISSSTSNLACLIALSKSCQVE